jgi:pyrroloquinoline quinone biosynthesis protein B
VYIRVLGSAAGGGFPQWNCGCANCAGVRHGTIAARPRTQESLAISADGEHWFLLNASPDVRQQIESFPPLHPKRARHTPIAGIVLTNGELDHCLGLLSLRERQPLLLWATEAVRRGFTQENVLYRTLERFPGQTAWHPLRPGKEEALCLSSGRHSGLSVEAVCLPGKSPLYLDGRQPPAPDHNVGLRIQGRRPHTTLVYLPGAAALTPVIRQLAEEADCLFFDGTFWSDDELSRSGVGDAPAAAMGHLPVGTSVGSLAGLGRGPGRRIYIHLNNTNPLLREDSAERAEVQAAGWEVAWDGMEVSL